MCVFKQLSFFSDFNKSKFSRQIFKNIYISNFTKIRPVEAELFYTEVRTDGQKNRQTNTTKLIVAFRTFASAYKN
jgi:hypothetical protein